MDLTRNEEQKKIWTDETDYIDIPALIRSMKRYARRYMLLAVPLILCMSVCLAVFTKPYTKKEYVAGGTFAIGLRLSNSYSFDYTFSSLTWERQPILTQMNSVLNALMDSGYITQRVKDAMGKKNDEELNGQIYMNSTYSTNFVDIYVVSDSLEDAEAIRETLFASLPDAVFPAFGFIEMTIEKLYTREESSPRAFLASPAVWAAGGAVLGIAGYLGLVFLYALRRRDVETPKDLRNLTDLPCLGKLPALKKKARFRKQGKTEEQNGSLVMTKEDQRAFEIFIRNVSEEIWQRQIRVLLLTGIGSGRGQSTIATEMEKAWRNMGKKVIRTDLNPKVKAITEEKIRFSLDQHLQYADLILIDGPSCDQSADVLILADCADAVITVIREGQSQPDEIREMFRSLQYAGAGPLGYVLSRCSHTGMETA